MCFGADPLSSLVRRSLSTYGVVVARPFARGRDPPRKLVRRDGGHWCTDSLDVLVHAGQPVCLGETTVRRYAPAALGSPSPGGSTAAAAVVDVYRSDSREVRYSTDPGAAHCGSLALELDPASDSVVELRVSFGGEELRLCAVDTISGRTTRTAVPFACQ